MNRNYYFQVVLGVNMRNYSRDVWKEKGEEKEEERRYVDEASCIQSLRAPGGDKSLEKLRIREMKEAC